jgi:hypothetical protein
MNRSSTGSTLMTAVAATAISLLLASAALAAAPKASAPKAGAYTGTAKSNGKTVTATGSVSKVVGKLNVQVIVPATFTCSDGSSAASSLSAIATVKSNKSFSYSAISSGIKYSMSGRFTSATALTGTISKEGPKSELEADPPTCSTGPISFTLHRK